MLGCWGALKMYASTLGPQWHSALLLVRGGAAERSGAANQTPWFNPSSVALAVLQVYSYVNWSSDGTTLSVFVQS